MTVLAFSFMVERSTKALFVSLMAPEDSKAPPLGSACAAAGLVSAGLLGKDEILILSPATDSPIGTILDSIVDANPRLVGFSLYCWNSLPALDLARKLRTLRPDLRIVAGGPDAEALAERGETEPFDAVFLGEAESSFSAWYARQPEADGLTATASGGSPASAPKAVFIRSDPSPEKELPSPWLLGILSPVHGGAIPWELSRGCPYHCSYCYEGRASSLVRHLPEARIEAELHLFLKAGVSEIFVLDPTFNIDKKRALEILKSLWTIASRIGWNFEIRAELLDSAQAEAFTRLPCFVQIGLQSSSPEVLALNGRSFDSKKFISGLRLLNKNGVVFGLDLIYGLPGDSLAGFRKSVDFALSFFPNHLDVFPLAVLPGTMLRRRSEELGLVYMPDPPYLLKRHQSFSEVDMASAARLAAALNCFYSRGRAVPWFSVLLAALRLSPSAFLASFIPPSGWEAQGHLEIEALQCSYVGKVFTARGKAALLPAALDLIRFNGALSRALAEGERSLLTLSYSHHDLEGPEILSLAAFAQRKPKCLCSVEILPGKEGPLVRSLRKRRG
ncbi:MAG: B12-binding domain-containing radical SAM protein [Spirochaetia bacterium]|nr:B12-binding domain-containing radical SAM protein [Spirochaetia bacterium]